MNETTNKENLSAEDLNAAIKSSGYTATSIAKPTYTRLWWSLAVSIAITIAWIVTSITSIADVKPLVVIVTSVFVFAFPASLFFEDSATRNVICFMAERSIRFPGLIWEFSFDGFLWLIGMKILFAVLGFLFGVICAVLGVIVGFVISPFVLPFAIYEYIKDKREGI